MNISKAVSLCIVLISFSYNLFAQYVLQGRITNGQKQPVADAAVFIIEAETGNIVQSVIPDSTGAYYFSLDNLRGKSVKASAAGYKDEYALLNDTALSVKINFTLNVDSNYLDEVEITVHKPVFERKIDRIVFNVSNSIISSGGNALDAVRKSPGVMIRQQDNAITLIGKSSVQVLINDRLLQLTGGDLIAYLQSIAIENIEKIEVITAPPAKYDASGNAGLINIVLKKNNKAGWNGNARAGYEQAFYAKGIANGDINFRKGGVNFYSNFSYSNGANNITERLNTPYPLQLFKVTDKYKRILKPLQYTAGMDYELHKNGTIGVQWMSNNANRINESLTSIYVAERAMPIADSTILTHGYSTVKNSNNILNLNYAWNIDTSGKKLYVNINRLWFNGKRYNQFETINYYADLNTPTGATASNRSDGRQDIAILTLQADAELPYSWASLSLGSKFSFIDNKSDNRFGFYQNGIYFEDAAVSNAFDYQEKVQALYVNAQRSSGKWSLQFGLRGEFTQTKGYSRNLNQENSNRYFNLFPTAYIQYQLNKDYALNINYSKRISRPDYKSLDPFRAYATLYHYNEGNPFLLPSINHNAELSCTYKSNYTFSAFYQYEHNHFAWVWMVDPVKNITSGISMNFADFTSYGVNGSASFHFFSRWDMQLQFSILEQQLRTKVYTQAQQSYKSPLYYGAVNNSFALNKSGTLLAEINFFYLSRYREDFLQVNAMAGLDGGLKILLLDKKITVALNASDILATQKATGIHVVSGQTINNYFDTRNVRAVFSYRFGNNALKAKRERSLGIEEEKSRAGS